MRGTEARHVIRGRKLIEILQPGKRVGDAGRGGWGWLGRHLAGLLAARVPANAIEPTLPSGEHPDEPRSPNDLAKAHHIQYRGGGVVARVHLHRSGALDPPSGAQRPQCVKRVARGPAAVQ